MKLLTILCFLVSASLWAQTEYAPNSGRSAPGTFDSPSGYPSSSPGPGTRSFEMSDEVTDRPASQDNEIQAEEAPLEEEVQEEQEVLDYSTAPDDQE